AREGLVVHPRDHEDVAGGLLLRHGAEQPGLVALEAGGGRPIQAPRAGVPSSPPGPLTSPTLLSPQWARRAARAAAAPAPAAAGGEDGVGAGLDGGREVLDGARAAAGDDGHVHRGTDGPDHLQIEAGLGAVGVHRVEQDLADTELGATDRPFDGVDAGAALA